MAANRTMGLIAGLTLASVMAGCASQAPSVTTPKAPEGPAIIKGDTLIIPADLSVQGGKGQQVVDQQTFRNIPQRISAGQAGALGLTSGADLGGTYPGLRYPGAYWGGAFSGLTTPGYCPAPQSFFSFGTPGILPKTLFIHPDVYYLRRNALYFPYSRLGGYFYPISVPYASRFYSPILLRRHGSIYPYTFSSSVCPFGTPFPGTLPGVPGNGDDNGNGDAAMAARANVGLGGTVGRGVY